MMQSETHKPTCNFAWLQWYLCEPLVLVMVYWMLVNIIIFWLLRLFVCGSLTISFLILKWLMHIIQIEQLPTLFY